MSRSPGVLIMVSFISRQTKLFVTSEVPVFQVFSDQDSDSGNPISDHMRGIMDDLVRLFSPLLSQHSPLHL